MSVEKTTSVTGRTANQAVQRMNAWSDLKNEKKFMDALTSFMMESWVTVSQVRERSGLNPNYELSEGELSKRIDEVSHKLTEKYKEVATLEAQKAQLISKSTGPGMSNRSIPGSPVPRTFQPIASSTPAQQLGYSGNVDISYSDFESQLLSRAQGNSARTDRSGSNPMGASRRRLQYTQNQSGGSSGCPPYCSGKYPSTNSSGSGAYQNFNLDYGF